MNALLADRGSGWVPILEGATARPFALAVTLSDADRTTLTQWAQGTTPVLPLRPEQPAQQSHDYFAGG